MARQFTLFTGQWADMPLEELARKAAAWGFDGLELACWGDHFEVDRALAEDGHVIGWEHTFSHEVRDLVVGIAEGAAVAPSFADGLQVSQVLAAAVEASAAAGAWTPVSAA